MKLSNHDNRWEYHGSHSIWDDVAKMLVLAALLGIAVLLAVNVGGKPW